MLGEHKHPIFLKSLFGVSSIILFGVYLLFISGNAKKDLVHLNGTITYFEGKYLDLPFKDDGKFKYLQIDKSPIVFELYCPIDSIDNIPKFMKLRELKLGDIVDLYFNESYMQTDKRVNRDMRFIDKDAKPYYIVEKNNTIAGICFIITGLIVFGVLLYLRIKDKII